MNILIPVAVLAAELAIAMVALRRSIRGAYVLLGLCIGQFAIPGGLFVILQVIRKKVILDRAYDQYAPQLGSTREWTEGVIVVLIAVILASTTVCMTILMLWRITRNSGMPTIPAAIFQLCFPAFRPFVALPLQPL